MENVLQDVACNFAAMQEFWNEPLRVQKCIWPKLIGPATRCDGIGKHRRTLQVSPIKLQQCGHSATHYGMFSYSPVMFIAAM